MCLNSDTSKLVCEIVRGAPALFIRFGLGQRCRSLPCEDRSSPPPCREAKMSLRCVEAAQALVKHLSNPDTLIAVFPDVRLTEIR